MHLALGILGGLAAGGWGAYRVAIWMIDDVIAYDYATCGAKHAEHDAIPHQEKRLRVVGQWLFYDVALFHIVDPLTPIGRIVVVPAYGAYTAIRRWMRGGVPRG